MFNWNITAPIQPVVSSPLSCVATQAISTLALMSAISTLSKRVIIVYGWPLMVRGEPRQKDCGFKSSASKRMPKYIVMGELTFVEKALVVTGRHGANEHFAGTTRERMSTQIWLTTTDPCQSPVLFWHTICSLQTCLASINLAFILITKWEE